MCACLVEYLCDRLPVLRVELFAFLLLRGCQGGGGRGSRACQVSVVGGGRGVNHCAPIPGELASQSCRVYLGLQHGGVTSLFYLFSCFKLSVF